MGQEDGDLFYLEFRPQGHHRLYIITPQRLFTPLSGLPTNPVGECTLIRPVCQTMDHVCLWVLWEEQRWPSDRHWSTPAIYFKRTQKALKRDWGRQTGSDKVADWHVLKPIFNQEVQEDKGGYSDTWDKHRTDAFSHKDKKDLKTSITQRSQITTLWKWFWSIIFCYCSHYCIIFQW